jgi:hypothetical protein
MDLGTINSAELLTPEIVLSETNTPTTAIERTQYYEQN